MHVCCEQEHVLRLYTEFLWPPAPSLLHLLPIATHFTGLTMLCTFVWLNAFALCSGSALPRRRKPSRYCAPSAQLLLQLEPGTKSHLSANSFLSAGCAGQALLQSPLSLTWHFQLFAAWSDCKRGDEEVRRRSKKRDPWVIVNGPETSDFC